MPFLEKEGGELKDRGIEIICFLGGGARKSGVVNAGGCPY